MGKSFTLEECLKRFKKIHDDKYDYSKVEYITGRQKVEIICLIHGSFFQRPYDHWNGHGCPSCGATQGNLKKVKTEKETIDNNGVSLFEKRYKKIHKKRKKKNNYKSAGIKGAKTREETTINGKTIEEIRVEKFVETRIQNGTFISSDKLSEKEKYYREVKKYTKESLKEFGHLITGLNKRSRKNPLDHVFSIFDGFQNNISPKIIGHISNLQILSQKENSVKNLKSWKSDIELFEDFNYFNKFGTLR